MNGRFAAVMAFYGYLTFKAGPDYLGTPNGQLAGGLASYALWEYYGRDFAYR